MLERPEFQALQQMAYEGDSNEIALNFCNFGLDQLSKVLMSSTSNKEKDCQESLHCFNEGLDQKCPD